MAFVVSSLQRPTLCVSSLAASRTPLAVARAKKRVHKPKVTPAPAPVLLPTAEPLPPGRTLPAPDPAPTPAWLSPYVSANGLGPMFSHPHPAPGLLKTKYALDLGTPTNQQQSGRCWIFASLNWLRQHVRELYGKEFEYSQNYVAYWDKFERANTHFNRMIAATDEDLDSRELMALNELFTDGGTWEFFYNVVNKYGVVPNYAMPETKLAGQSHRYTQLLQRRVREIGGLLREKALAGASATELTAIKAQGMQEVRRTLDACLGVPPKSFLWRDPTNPKAPWIQMSPKAFLADNPARLDDMVYLTNYPQHPPRTRLVFDDVTNVQDAPVSHALNVDMSVVKQAIRRSLRAGEAVLCMSDTASLDEKHDLWSMATDQTPVLLGIDAGLHLDKGSRVDYSVAGATHGMIFSGCDDVKTRKYNGEILAGADAELVEPLWQVENSWGGEPMYMTDRWVDAYLFGIVVNKNHLSAKARRWVDDNDLPTKHLPPWSTGRLTLH